MWQRNLRAHSKEHEASRQPFKDNKAYSWVCKAWLDPGRRSLSEPVFSHRKSFSGHGWGFDTPLLSALWSCVLFVYGDRGVSVHGVGHESASPADHWCSLTVACSGELRPCYGILCLPMHHKHWNQPECLFMCWGAAASNHSLPCHGYLTLVSELMAMIAICTTITV